MSITARIVLAAAGLLSLACLAPLASAEPVGTAFTYQGVISDVDGPIDDTLDFRCTLWDDATFGIQFGTTQLLAATTVSGVFTLELDFGADPFEEPDAMWLQVEVSEDGGSIYTPLTRQRLMPSPYSLSTRALKVGADGRVEIGMSEPSITIRSDGGVQVGENPGSGLIDFSVENNEVIPGPRTAVSVRNFGATGGFGVDVQTSGTAIRGQSLAGSGTFYGVFGGTDGNNEAWGVFSSGRFGATGTKSFVIDHPLDPANRMLLHYSSEAPEPLNTYSGTAYLDALGQAIILLPDYFESINTDYRYQLTPIGAAAPSLHIAAEVQNNRFAIAGGFPGLKVSWQVTATRNDAYVRQRGAPVEVEKSGDQRGRYLMPHLHGAPASQSMHAPPGESGRTRLYPGKSDR